MPRFTHNAIRKYRDIYRFGLRPRVAVPRATRDVPKRGCKRTESPGGIEDSTWPRNGAAIRSTRSIRIREGGRAGGGERGRVRGVRADRLIRGLRATRTKPRGRARILDAALLLAGPQVRPFGPPHPETLTRLESESLKRARCRTQPRALIEHLPQAKPLAPARGELDTRDLERLAHRIHRVRNRKPSSDELVERLERINLGDLVLVERLAVVLCSRGRERSDRLHWCRHCGLLPRRAPRYEARGHARAAHPTNRTHSSIRRELPARTAHGESGVLFNANTTRAGGG